jgi:hypothetical protein
MRLMQLQYRLPQQAGQLASHATYGYGKPIRSRILLRAAQGERCAYACRGPILGQL